MNGTSRNCFNYSNIDRILPTKEEVDFLCKDIKIIDKVAETAILSGDLETKINPVDK